MTSALFTISVSTRDFRERCSKPGSLFNSSIRGLESRSFRIVLFGNSIVLCTTIFKSVPKPGHLLPQLNSECQTLQPNLRREPKQSRSRPTERRTKRQGKIVQFRPAHEPRTRRGRRCHEYGCDKKARHDNRSRRQRSPSFTPTQKVILVQLRALQRLLDLRAMHSS